VVFFMWMVSSVLFLGISGCLGSCGGLYSKPDVTISVFRVNAILGVFCRVS